MLTKYLERIIEQEETPMADQIASVDIWDMSWHLEALHKAITTGSKLNPIDIDVLADVVKILRKECEY